jgi:hypothetical protein
MGCGCKNKDNQNPQSQQNQQNQQVKPNVQTAPNQQSVHETIKKTLEKYYTVKKG